MYWTLSKTIKQTYTSPHHLLWLRYSSFNCWYNFPLSGNFPVKNPWCSPSGAATGCVQRKSCSQKLPNIHRKTPVLGSLCDKKKRDSNTGAFPGIVRNFKNTYFKEYQQTAASSSFLNTLRLPGFFKNLFGAATL